MVACENNNGKRHLCTRTTLSYAHSPSRTPAARRTSPPRLPQYIPTSGTPRGSSSSGAWLLLLLLVIFGEKRGYAARNTKHRRSSGLACEVALGSRLIFTMAAYDEAGGRLRSRGGAASQPSTRIKLRFCWLLSRGERCHRVHTSAYVSEIPHILFSLVLSSSYQPQTHL